MKNVTLLSKTTFLILISILLASCFGPLALNTDSENRGTIEISLAASLQASTITPTIPINTLSYTVTITQDGNTNTYSELQFDPDTGSISVTGVPLGSGTIQIQGVLAGAVIAEDLQTFDLQDATQPLSITSILRPTKEGNGSLAIDVYYPTSEVSTTEVTLTPLGGLEATAAQLTLSAEILSDETTGYPIGERYSSNPESPLPSGSYLLTIKFKKDGIVSATRVESVQVFDGLISTGELEMSETDFNTAPAAPTGITVAQGGTGYTVAWSDNANTESGFIIYLDGVQVTTAEPNNTEAWIDSSSIGAGTHFVTVAAYNIFGVSESEPATVVGPAELVGEWLFTNLSGEDGVGGLTAYADGTPVPTVTADRFGDASGATHIEWQAAEMEGYWTITPTDTSDLIDYSNGKTVVFWFRRLAATTAGDVIAHGNWRTYWDGTQGMLLYVNDGTAWNWFTIPVTTIPIETWTQISFTMGSSGTTIRASYYNTGTSQDVYITYNAAALELSAGSSMNPLYIGHNFGTAGTMSATMDFDDLRIYNGELTESEINALYSEEPQPYIVTTVTAAPAPPASATVGSDVTLTGTTLDQTGTTVFPTYTWEFQSYPSGFSGDSSLFQELTAGDSANVYFTPTVAGDYTILMTAQYGTLFDTDTVTVTAQAVPQLSIQSTWAIPTSNKSSIPAGNIESIAVSGEFVALGSSNGGGLAISSDYGSTWSHYSSADQLSGTTITDIEIQNSKMYVDYGWSTNQIDVFSWSGTSWILGQTIPSSATSVRNPIIEVVGPVGSETIYRADTSSYGSVAVTKYNGTDFYDFATTNGFLGDYVKDLYAHETNGNLYAIDQNGHLQYSAGGVANWVQLLPAGGVFTHIHGDQNIIVAISDLGVWISWDDGTTWTNYTGPNSGDTVYEVYVDSTAIYAAT